MSRPLGSRNKSTLERLEFERKVRNLMEKSNAEYIDKFRGVSRDYDKPNSGYVFSSENPVSSNPVRVKELNNKTSNNKASSVHVSSEYSDTSDSLNPGYDNNQNNQNVSNSIKEKETENLKEKENTIESTTSNATQEQPKKRRGRPRKNPSPEISNVENVENVETTDTDTTKTESVDNSVDNVDNFTETENNPATETDNNPTVTVTEPSKRRSKTSSDNTPHCSRCDAVIVCTPSRIDTNNLSGTSDWHRNCPRYVILCNHCSNELSEIIDNWLWNNGQGVVPKPWSDFGVKEMRMAEKKFENREKEN